MSNTASGPILVAMGAVHDAPIAMNDEPTCGPIMRLCATSITGSSTAPTPRS